MENELNNQQKICLKKKQKKNCLSLLSDLKLVINKT